MNVLIPNPRDIPGFVKELSKYKINMFPAVNTLYNGLLNNPDFAKLDFSGLKVCNGGGMAVQQAVADKWLKVTGLPDHRRLRPVGNLAGRHLQPRRHARHSPAPSACRCRRPKSPSWTTTAIAVPLGRARRNRHPRPAGHGRLLEPSRRNRQGHDARRLLQDRRRRHHGRARLRAHRRPQEGHDPGVRLQRVSERNRGRGGVASGRAGMRLRRRARREFRRGGQAVRGAARTRR